MCQLHMVPASPNRVFRGARPEYQNTRIPHMSKTVFWVFRAKTPSPATHWELPRPPDVAGHRLGAPPRAIGFVRTTGPRWSDATDRRGRPPQLCLQSAIRQLRRRRTPLARCRSGNPQSAIHPLCLFLLLSNHKHVIPAEAGIIIPRRFPLPMLRVARIVPEFCACAGHGNHVTPCAERNKESSACGLFYLFNCCTNVIAHANNGVGNRNVGEGATW